MSPDKFKKLTYKTLNRFLESSVGQHWDKVFSKISAMVPPGDPEGLKDRALRKVDTTAYYEGDTLMMDPWASYYVNPKGKQLMADDRESYRSRYQRSQEEAKLAWEKDHKIIDSSLQFHRIDGNWYRINMEPIPVMTDEEVYLTCYDALGSISCQRGRLQTFRALIHGAFDKYHVRGVWAKSKEAASKKDIRNYKLNEV